ncbi:MAG: hypothetical protein Q8K07_09745 [Methylicorpusculum sp.]|uniref:hypothetical protein n=1 Tax=Methylicorpusculum sp. TaxID=2713644 RepID=UPI00272EEEA4|nr:hypothetical protein [Methylicorpusculum sp.]MDP2202289.1 hypothetical protein [Methylicorpusculum sp.]
MSTKHKITTDAIRLKARLEQQLGEKEVWIVIQLVEESMELRDVTYQTAIPQCSRSTSFRPLVKPLVKSKLERLLHQLDRYVLTGTRAENVEQLAAETSDHLDVNRDPEGRIFL